MRVAVISDVHGNLPALEAVLEEIRREKPDVIVSCGDVASGPMPAETIDVLRGLPDARFVRGNADRGLIDEFDGKSASPLPGPFADWCAKQINREQRDFLASFEETVTIDGVDGAGRVLFCHATPRNDVDLFIADTAAAEVRKLFGPVDADLVVCGHTHMQFDRQIDRLRVVNAGSVGMPYGEPGAYWTMLGPDVGPRRTEYDRRAAADRMRKLSWPMAAKFADENVLSVPSVEQAREAFRQAAARLRAG